MTTLVYEREENRRPSTSSASVIQLQEENQSLYEENCYLKQEVENGEDKVHQLTHELTQKQMLMKIYHKELEGLDGKKTEKKGSHWKTNFNCLKSKAQILENEKWELSVELEARKADLANREVKLESLHTSYIKQIESLKRNVSRNEDILREQGERNATLLAEKTLLKEKLDRAAIEVSKAREDLEMRDKQMEQCVHREMDIQQQIQSRQQEIDHLRRLYEDQRDDTKVSRGSSLSLNGRSRSWSANEATEHISIKEELEESLRRNNSFGQDSETGRSINRQCSSFDETEFPDPFSPCRESRSPGGQHLARSPTYSVGGDSGWGSDDETSPHFHRFSERHRQKPRKLSSRLQLVKPMEGSETLHQWKKLATPSLTKLFEPRDGIVTREELRSERCAHVKWNTREQMLSEPEEDDDPEMMTSQNEETRDPRRINQSVVEEITHERSGAPRRVCSMESLCRPSEPMRPRSRSLVEKVCQSGLKARRQTLAAIRTVQQTAERKNTSDKCLNEPTLLASEPFSSLRMLRRCSTESTSGLGDIVRGFLSRREKRMSSRESLTSSSHSEPSSPKTDLHPHIYTESFTSRLGELIARAFHSNHEQAILCVPASQPDVTDSSWRLQLPTESPSESTKKLKIKIGSRSQCDSDHPLEQARRGPVSVLHTLTSMRKGNYLTGGFGATSDYQCAAPYRESPYAGDIVLDMF